jgi:Flp pilus assembly protein TadG
LISLPGRYPEVHRVSRGLVGGRCRRGGAANVRVRSLRREEGQATIEFAIVLPLVLLLIVGLIEFGKAFNYWLDLNHLANEGARWVAVDRIPGNPNPTGDQIKVYLSNQINTNDLRDKVLGANGKIELCYEGTGQVGDAVRVTIEAPYSFEPVRKVVELAGAVFGAATSNVGDVTLRGRSTMRLEQTRTGGAGWAACP